MCDCYFNRYIPPSSDQIVIVRPQGITSYHLTNIQGKTFVTGLAEQFDIRYDDSHPRLKNYLSQNEFASIIDTINDTLYSFFPCTFCFYFGYFCCPCTLGLSFCLPNSCVSDAEQEVKQLIFRVNKQKLHPKNVHLELRKECSTSWLEFHLGYEEGRQANQGNTLEKESHKVQKQKMPIENKLESNNKNKDKQQRAGYSELSKDDLDLDDQGEMDNRQDNNTLQ